MPRATRSPDAVYLPDVRAIRETPRALLCVIDGEERWVPKSCIHDDSSVYDVGHEGELALCTWWAAKEGLE